jgi:hypothetical protein
MEGASNTHEDILHYVHHRMERSMPDSGLLNDSQCQAIATQSEVHFLYASLACDIILGNGQGGQSAEERFNNIMTTSSCNEDGVLDNLYSLVLGGIFDMKNETVRYRFTTAMAYVLAAFVPLSVQSLAAIHQHDPSESNTGTSKFDIYKTVLQWMGVLLTGISESDPGNTPILLCHTSFRDFLTDVKRSKEFFVDTSSIHRSFILSSLDMMGSATNGLRFNICELETSYLPNSNIRGLEEKIQKHISGALAYCSCYWAQHLHSMGPDTGSYLDNALQFFIGRFLYWLEALSLLSELGAAYRAVAIIKHLLQAFTVSYILNKIQLILSHIQGCTSSQGLY